MKAATGSRHRDALGARRSSNLEQAAMRCAALKEGAMAIHWSNENEGLSLDGSFWEPGSGMTVTRAFGTGRRGAMGTTSWTSKATAPTARKTASRRPCARPRSSSASSHRSGSLLVRVDLIDSGQEYQALDLPLIPARARIRYTPAARSSGRLKRWISPRQDPGLDSPAGARWLPAARHPRFESPMAPRGKAPRASQGIAQREPAAVSPSAGAPSGL